jgi:hypothetical protein
LRAPRTTNETPAIPDSPLPQIDGIFWGNGARTAAFFAQVIDSEIRLETHVATLASNNSLLVSEFVRSFVKRFESKRIGAQLNLPNIGGDNGRY